MAGKSLRPGWCRPSLAVVCALLVAMFSAQSAHAGRFASPPSYAGRILPKERRSFYPELEVRQAQQQADEQNIPRDTDALFDLLTSQYGLVQTPIQFVAPSGFQDPLAAGGTFGNGGSGFAPSPGPPGYGSPGYGNGFGPSSSDPPGTTATGPGLQRAPDGTIIFPAGVGSGQHIFIDADGNLYDKNGNKRTDWPKQSKKLWDGTVVWRGGAVNGHIVWVDANGAQYDNDGNRLTDAIVDGDSNTTTPPPSNPGVSATGPGLQRASDGTIIFPAGVGSGQHIFIDANGNLYDKNGNRTNWPKKSKTLPDGTVVWRGGAVHSHIVWVDANGAQYDNDGNKITGPIVDGNSSTTTPPPSNPNPSPPTSSPGVSATGPGLQRASDGTIIFPAGVGSGQHIFIDANGNLYDKNGNRTNWPKKSKTLPDGTVVWRGGAVHSHIVWVDANGAQYDNDGNKITGAIVDGNSSTTTPPPSNPNTTPAPNNSSTTPPTSSPGVSATGPAQQRAADGTIVFPAGKGNDDKDMFIDANGNLYDSQGKKRPEWPAKSKTLSDGTVVYRGGKVDGKPAWFDSTGAQYDDDGNKVTNSQVSGDATNANHGSDATFGSFFANNKTDDGGQTAVARRDVNKDEQGNLPLTPEAQQTADFISANYNVLDSRLSWGDQNVLFTQDPISGNDKALRIFYPQGSYSPSAAAKGKPLGGAGFLPIPFTAFNGTSSQGVINPAFAQPGDPGAVVSRPAMLLHYKVSFAPNFDFAKGGLLPGFYSVVGKRDPSFGTEGGSSLGVWDSSYASCAGGRRDGLGTSCFSNRLMWRENGALEIFSYIPTDPVGDYDPCNQRQQFWLCNPKFGTSIGRGSFYFKAGQSYDIHIVQLINSDESFANGVVGVYVNGKLAIWSGDMLLRTGTTVGGSTSPDDTNSPPQLGSVSTSTLNNASDNDKNIDPSQSNVQSDSSNSTMSKRGFGGPQLVPPPGPSFAPTQLGSNSVASYYQFFTQKLEEQYSKVFGANSFRNLAPISSVHSTSQSSFSYSDSNGNNIAGGQSCVDGHCVSTGGAPGGGDVASGGGIAYKPFIQWIDKLFIQTFFGGGTEDYATPVDTEIYLSDITLHYGYSPSQFYGVNAGANVSSTAVA